MSDDHPTGTVTTIMHDTVDLDGAVAFWTEILGLEVVHRDDSYVYLSRLSPEGPHLAFQQVPEARPGKNRLHLDLRVPDREAFAARVVELGGSVLGEHQQGDYPVWSVMADPQGNEFCIYTPASRE
jgi:predicted enzyme related to lactoylglutathione lyase